MTTYVDRLEELVNLGKTTREIAEIVGKSRGLIQWRLAKMGLNTKLRCANAIWNEDFFNKIDTPEKAYIIGFMLGDGAYTSNIFEVSIALKDKCVIDFISQNTGGNIRVSNTYIPEQRRFPRARLTIGNKNILRDLSKLFVFRKKEERKIPIVSERVERYLVLGFFDAEGCITWGRRKDRNRVWQKASFTSSLSLLTGIQKIMDKQEISTQIRPKASERCYLLEVADKKRVLSLMDYIYGDGSFVILPRKYDKAVALRRELGENGETV